MNHFSDMYQLPCSTSEQNTASAFNDLMLMSGEYYSPTYVTGGVQHATVAVAAPAHQKMDMGCISPLSDGHHRLLGKRKSYTRDGDDDYGDDKSLKSNGDKKQNHSEIEKRRRDKMNTYITELATMIPMCHANPRKLDKLTVLRMAVQHLRSVRGAVHSYTDGHYKPSFLSDEELKDLILQAAEGFVFVVGCDRGRILFVSESVSQVLNHSQGDLVGQSVFDILHPKDVPKVKEQLFSSDLNPRERLIDSKTMLPVKTDVPMGATRLSPGSRRSFLCRMKCRPSVQVKEEADTTTGSHMQRKKSASDKRYCVIHCTGYMKSWAPAKLGLEESEGNEDNDGCNLSCLVAVGRVQHSPAPQIHAARPGPQSQPVHYVSRHAMDGTFMFIDQRAAATLGFLPQELVGVSMYDFFHPDDTRDLAECHRAALRSLDTSRTPSYRFRVKDGGFVRIQSEWRQFRNPWTKEMEYIIAKNVVLICDTSLVESALRPDGSSMQSCGFEMRCEGASSMQRLISPHEASFIGKQIAREALRKAGGSSSNDSSPSPVSIAIDQDVCLPISSIESPMSTSILDESHISSALHSFKNVLSPDVYHDTVRNNVPLSSSADGASSDQDLLEVVGGDVHASPVAATRESNDEAAMAVIMSLLEADAGLGGPVDFSGLPWPLP